MGVLMPETEDGTQGLPQQPSPVSIPPNPHKGRRGTLDVLMPFFLTPLPVFPAHRGEKLGVLTNQNAAVCDPTIRPQGVRHAPFADARLASLLNSHNQEKGEDAG